MIDSSRKQTPVTITADGTGFIYLEGDELGFLPVPYGEEESQPWHQVETLQQALDLGADLEEATNVTDLRDEPLVDVLALWSKLNARGLSKTYAPLFEERSSIFRAMTAEQATSLMADAGRLDALDRLATCEQRLDTWRSFPGIDRLYDRYCAESTAVAHSPSAKIDRVGTLLVCMRTDTQAFTDAGQDGMIWITLDHVAARVALADSLQGLEGFELRDINSVPIGFAEFLPVEKLPSLPVDGTLWFDFPQSLDASPMEMCAFIHDCAKGSLQASRERANDPSGTNEVHASGDVGMAP